MKNRIEIYDNVNYEIIATCYWNYIPLIGSHLIMNNMEFIVIDHLITDYEVDVLKIIVRKINSNDRSYKGKIL